MVTHLYTNFLENGHTYQENIDFWKTIVHTLLSVENISLQSYLATTKPDGSLYLDGNPIYQFKVENSNRAVRIIQEEIERDSIEFSAWLDTLELADESVVDELVISLELSQESCLLAVELINAWVITGLSKPKMEKYIDKIFALKDTIGKVENSTQKQVAYA